MPGPVMTIGHSNRTLQEFLHILRAHEVRYLADIRTIPRSRHNPQFNRETLPAYLAAVGIEYKHMPGLGGLRHPRPDSNNTGWRNSGFRGYADYMQTPEFESNLAELLDWAEGRHLAIMCAEAVPWRCHRTLVADAISARGTRVEHIMSADKANPHEMTPFARIEGIRVSYPSEGSLF